MLKLKSYLQTPWSIIARRDGRCHIISTTGATIAKHIDEDAARVIVDSVNHAKSINERSAILDERGK